MRGTRKTDAVAVIGCALLLTAMGCGTSDKDASDAKPRSQASSPARAAAVGGRIVFDRGDVGAGESSVYVMDGDGSHVMLLLGRGANHPRWSPDGTAISLFCCDDGMAAHYLDPTTNTLRETAAPDPALETHCGYWSPDGKRVLCESFGVDDPKRNGIYTVRVSDGGGLSRVTSNPGGDDIPGDFSPDGKRIVFVRLEQDRPVGIFVVGVDGSGLRRLTPKGMVLDESGFAGRWSPNDAILLVARDEEGGHKKVWIVDADGRNLRRLPLEIGCELGCDSPTWSPDGAKIALVVGNGSGEDIYTVNADGTKPVKLSHGDDPDWEPGPS